MFNPIRYLITILLISALYSVSFAQQKVSRQETTPKAAEPKETSVIKQLSRGADVIVTGKVTEKQSNWNEKKTRIYTVTTVAVDEYLKGQNSGSFVEVTTPGGEVGDVGELYTHMPRFEDNEEVLVFLKRDGDRRSYKVLNGEEGKITVLRDAETSEKVTRSHMRIETLKEQIKSFINQR